MTALWGVTQCSLVETYPHLGGNCCLHAPGSRICKAEKETVDRREMDLCVGQWEMLAQKIAALRSTVVRAPDITHFDGVGGQIAEVSSEVGTESDGRVGETVQCGTL